MRSIFAVLLAAVLAVSAFTGCGARKTGIRTTPTPAPTATVTPEEKKQDRDEDKAERDEDKILQDGNNTAADTDRDYNEGDRVMTDPVEDGLVENSPLADDGVVTPAENG